MSSKQNLGKALITGASSGIGAMYADRLARRGYDLILVARDEARLKEAAKRLGTETGRRVEVVRADLTDRVDLLRVENLLRADGQVSLLVNNAGAAVAGPLADADPDQLEKLIALNVTALTRLSRAASAGFAKRGAGSIVNIASVVAVMPGQVSATYSATKAFVLNFTQGLQQELKGKGIYVQAVLPGATRTEIWERGGLYVNEFPPEMVMATHDLVDAALVGFDRKEAVTVPPLADVKEWEAFEAARVAMAPRLSVAQPAPRYKS